MLINLLRFSFELEISPFMPHEALRTFRYLSTSKLKGVGNLQHQFNWRTETLVEK